MPDMSPETLLAAARAFQESRVILTGAELDVFSLLAEEPLTAAGAASRLGAEPRALTAVLDALAAMELLEKADGRYRLAAGAGCLASGATNSIHAMLLHQAALWHRWTALTRLVGGTPLPDRTPEEATRAFIGAMNVVSSRQADRMAELVPIGNARRMIDIGGGPGTYTAAFLKRSPSLAATLFDLPLVVGMARERLAAAGLAERVTFVEGDFEKDELPGGYDFAWLSAIIHQNSQEQNEALYRRIFRALVPGGRLVIRDHVMEPDRTRPRAGALFAINMLVGTPGGGTYTLDEIRSGLERTGFTGVKLLNTGPIMDGLVEATRP